MFSLFSQVTTCEMQSATARREKLSFTFYQTNMVQGHSELKNEVYFSNKWLLVKTAKQNKRLWI